MYQIFYLQICKTQDKTRQMIVLLARLQKNKQMLETLRDEDKSIWDQKLKEVQTMKVHKIRIFPILGKMALFI